MTLTRRLPVSVLIAAKNEAANLAKCLAALGDFARVVVLDSHSTDGTIAIAAAHGAEVVQFDYRGGYPKKRQWALDTLTIDTPWVLLLDADEVVPQALIAEIQDTMRRPEGPAAYLITKGFHFLGKRFRHGGFSHAAVLLFRPGAARFEHLLHEPADALDMEVHERLLVDGEIGRLATPLVHEDFKGLEAYLDRHNRYSTWEAKVRFQDLSGCSPRDGAVQPRLFGDVQQRRRWLKRLAMRMPGEPALWFLYHYVARLGFLEGRRGLIASRIRAQYISQVRAKLYELQLRGEGQPQPTRDGAAVAGAEPV
jgi:glycosyltransferase involved in cell wall biosynthesis